MVRILLSVGNIKINLLTTRLGLGINLEFDFLGLISFESDEASSWLHKIRSARDKLILQVHSSLVDEHNVLTSIIPDSGNNHLSLINTWMSTFKDDEPGVLKITSAVVDGIDDNSLLIRGMSFYMNWNMVSLIGKHSDPVVDVLLRQIDIIWLT